ERFVDGRLDPAELARLPDEDVVARLTEVLGVGRWTAEGFLAIALHRDDVVLPGDLALRKAIQRAYTLDHLPSQSEVLAIAEAWPPYRSLAVNYLFASVFRAWAPPRPTRRGGRWRPGSGRPSPRGPGRRAPPTQRRRHPARPAGPGRRPPRRCRGGRCRWCFP